MKTLNFKEYWYCLLLGVVVTGCTRASSTEAMLDDYLHRVENTTDTVVIEEGSYHPTLRLYPRRRNRRVSPEDIRIGFLDFLALGKCDLQTLVGERNSGMGKVMPDSQRLIYEHRFLVQAKACYEALRKTPKDDPELLKQIRDIIAVKERNLPKAYWNATFGSPEFEKMFSRSSLSRSANDPHMPAGSIEEALRYLIDVGARLGTNDLELNAKELEHHYFQLQTHRYGGRLLHSISILTFYLDAVARTIEKRLAQRPLCYQKRPNRTARIMHTVFMKYYAGQIGPYLSVIHRRGKIWIVLINRLAEAQQQPMPHEFAEYYDAQLSLDKRDGLWQSFQRAIAGHTQAWQELLGQCGLMPGSKQSVQ